MTNLIHGSFEKSKLVDAIRAENLDTLGTGKWTYGTCFLFLHDPERYLLVKPEGLKKTVEIAGYPLDYDPALWAPPPTEAKVVPPGMHVVRQTPLATICSGWLSIKNQWVMMEYDPRPPEFGRTSEFP